MHVLSLKGLKQVVLKSKHYVLINLKSCCLVTWTPVTFIFLKPLKTTYACRTCKVFPSDGGQCQPKHVKVLFILKIVALDGTYSLFIFLIIFVLDSLTTSLSPLKPFPLPPTNEPTIEVIEFEGTTEKDVHPYTTFLNHLYVYPQSLAFDMQKTFTRARNIACVVELLESDAEGAQPLCVSVCNLCR
jgi:hypothetical protein